MAKCFLHPGRDSVMAFAGKNYCQNCKTGQEAAVAKMSIDPLKVHVEPKRCFLTFKGGDTWAPLDGTGCAHWVSHQLDIGNGAPSNKCLEGHTIRVPDAIQGMSEVEMDDVKEQDIWANDALNHMGMVTKVNRGADAGPLTIMITHDSSHLKKVSENDFAGYFHGQGKFYRK
jgi:hypothetical protein